MLINDSIDQESIGDIVEKSQKLIYWFSSIDSELIFDPMTDEKSRELRIASRRVSPQQENRCFHVNDEIGQQTKISMRIIFIRIFRLV